MKSEFFFLCIFTISLERRQLSRSHSYFTILSTRAIHSSEHFPRIALSFLKCWLVTLRHVTSRFVTVNLFSNKRTPNGYYVPPWVNFFVNFFKRDFLHKLKLISFFNARYLTDSLRGPVLTLRRGALRRVLG